MVRKEIICLHLALRPNTICVIFLVEDLQFISLAVSVLSLSLFFFLGSFLPCCLSIFLSFQ